MERQNQVTVEDLSPVALPVEEDQQEQGFVQAPQQEQAPVEQVPQQATPQQTNVSTMPPVLPVTSDEVMELTREPIDRFAQDVRREPLTAGVDASTFKRDPRQGPLILPRSVKEREQAGDLSTQEDFRKAIDEMGSLYLKGLFLTGDAERDEIRKERILNARGFGIPVFGEDGRAVLDTSETRLSAYKYNNIVQFDPDADLNERLAFMVENFDSKQGEYHFFGDDQFNPSIISTGYREMLQEKNNPVLAFFSRVESEEGGMGFYNDILETSGYKDTARRTYLIRQQAISGSPFGALERQRIGAQFVDTAAFVGNLVTQAPSKVQDITAVMPLAVLAATGDLDYIFDPANEGKPLVKGAKTILEKWASAYNYDPIEFDYVADRVAKETGLPIEQVEQVLTYSPDLLTQSSRLLAETIATGGGVLAVSKGLASRQSRQLSDFVVAEVTREGGQELAVRPKNIVEALELAEERGMNATYLIQKFVKTRGGTDTAREFLADGLDFDLQVRAMAPGPFRAKALAVPIQKQADKVTELEKKLEIAERKGRSPEWQEGLKEQVAKETERLRILREETMFPPKVKQFLKDEAIATGVFATTYQAVYNYGATGDDFDASMAGALGAILAVMPGPRQRLGASFEDAIIGLTSTGDEKATRKAAAKIRRFVRKAPPELQDQILAFAEKREKLLEKTSAMVFPEGHPRAGQPVFDPDTFDQAFFELSGLLTMQHLKKTQLGDTVNVQRDAAQLSQGLQEIEDKLAKQEVKHQAMAELMDSLRFYVYSDKFDPIDDGDNLVRQLLNTYDSMGERIKEETSQITKFYDQRKDFLENFLSGTLPTEVMDQVVTGEVSLVHYLNDDKVRYLREARGGIDPDDPRANMADAELLSEYYADLQRRVTQAIKNNRYYKFDPDEELKTTDFHFNSLVRVRESKVYDEQTKAFDNLRNNPEFSGARIDMTDIFDRLLVSNDDTPVFDHRALSSMTTEIGKQGTESSRKLAGLELPSHLTKKVEYLFEDAATDYIEFAEDTFGEELVSEVMEVNKLSETSSPIDRFIALREYVKGLKDELDPETLEKVTPRLGLDPTRFMHLVSGIGGTAASKAGTPGAIAPAQLREKLLERGKTEFFQDFFDPTKRELLKGWGDSYEEVRAGYRNDYIVPFREMAPEVRAIIRSGDDDRRLKPGSFNRFLNYYGVKPDANAADLREGLKKALEELTGGKPIDVTTEEGVAIRELFTNYVREEMARTAGSKVLQEHLLGIQRGKGSLLPPQIIRPDKTQEIERALRSGTTETTGARLEMLLRTDENGNFILRDVNGQPLVDPDVVNAIDFDAGMAVDKRFRDALIDLKNMITDEATAVRKSMNDYATREGQEIAARKSLVQKLGKGHIGQGFLNLADETGGLANINTLRSDYIAEQVARGVSEEVAGEAFDRVKSQSVIDYLFSGVTTEGRQRAFKELNDETGEVVSVVQAQTQIDSRALREMIGLQGDRVSTSRQEKVIRSLLGDEVFEHLKFIGQELFVVDPKTGAVNVTGVALPLSAESLLSRGTSYMRGVISMRWLISEAAIRNARLSNLELTKMMLFDPKVGKELLRMIKENDYKVTTETEWVRVLISQFAKNQALQQFEIDEQEQGPQQPTTNTEKEQMQSLSLDVSSP